MWRRMAWFGFGFAAGRQSTALDGANQLGVRQDEVFAPDRAVGSNAAV